LAGGHGHARASLAAGWTAQEDRLSGTSSPAEVQIFGRRDSRATQKALRYFRERRVDVVFVDLAVKAMAATELRRFSQRFGGSALIDSTSRAYRDAGLAYMRVGEEESCERRLAKQVLLRLPLVRAGNLLSVGLDENSWRVWLSGGAAQ